MILKPVAGNVVSSATNPVPPDTMVVRVFATPNVMVVLAEMVRG
jgi:hypothetical protein